MSVAHPWIWVVWLAVFHTPVALAQLEQQIRLELPKSSSSVEQFDVFPMGSEGVLLVSRTVQPFGIGQESWVFSRLDTQLKAVWNKEVKLDFRYTPIMAYRGEFFAYWLFAETDTDQFLFLQIDLDRGEIDTFKGKLLSGVNVQQFKVIGSKALVAGTYQGRPIVLVHSFFDGTTKVLPGLYERNTEINNVDIDESLGLIRVITYAYRKGFCQFLIKSYNYEGKLLQTTSLSDPKHSFISGQIVPLDDENSYLIGNYAKGCVPFSQGLYVAHIEDNEPAQPEFIEFSELQNFFNYLNPKRRERTLERINKRKSLGKENRFRYRLLVHDLVRTDEEIILVAEVYYPNYKNATPVVAAGPNRMYARTLDGFRYTHALVVGFDKYGKYLWDNSFAIKDLVSFDLQQMVQLTKINDYYVLAYPQEGNIHTEVINRSKVVVESEKFELTPLAVNEKVLYSENASLGAWYDNFFLAYGIQRIANEKAPVGAAPREVFYINKLAYKLPEKSATSSGPNHR